MAIDALQTVDLIEELENFVGRIRSDKKEIHTQLDYTYAIENQSIVLLEVRPDWVDTKIIRQHPFAKVTFVKRTGIWKVYWLRGNLKWYLYEPRPNVKSLKEFLSVVESDDHCCFFG